MVNKYIYAIIVICLILVRHTLHPIDHNGLFHYLSCDVRLYPVFEMKYSCFPNTWILFTAINENIYMYDTQAENIGVKYYTTNL